MKPLNVLKPFSLKFMAIEKSTRKGGRQRRGNTAKDLPPDLYELYKSDPEEPMENARTESNGFEDIGQRNGSSTDSSPTNMLRRVPSRAHGEISYTKVFSPNHSLHRTLPRKTRSHWD